MPKQETPAATPAVKKIEIPKRESVKPELLPADLGGGDIQFLKRTDYAKRTAETIALKFKAEIKKDHVTMMLDALDKGLYEMPEGDNPPEMLKLYEVVTADYKAGQDKVVEDAIAAQKKADEDAAAKKELAEKEDKIFAATKDQMASFGDLSDKFDTTGMNRFVAKDGVSDEELLSAFNTSLGLDDFNNWMQGDLIVALEARGQLNVVSRLCENRGKKYATVYGNARTSRAIPPEARRLGISQTIYREIALAKFTGDKQEKAKTELLKDVAAGKHTTQTVREAVKKAQGKTTPTEKAPEDDESHKFLVIDPNCQAGQEVNVATGFPKALQEQGAIIVDYKTLKMFAGWKKDPKNRWEDIPVYTPAEPDPQEAAAAAAAAKKKPAAKKK